MGGRRWGVEEGRGGTVESRGESDIIEHEERQIWRPEKTTYS